MHSNIEVIISAGVECYDVPYLIGISKDEAIKLLEEYTSTLRNGRLSDFESKAIFAKTKHYITILKKVDALLLELNK